MLKVIDAKDAKITDSIFLNNQLFSVNEVINTTGLIEGDTTIIHYGWNIGNSISFSRYAQILVWREE